MPRMSKNIINFICKQRERNQKEGKINRDCAAIECTDSNSQLIGHRININNTLHPTLRISYFN